MGWNGSCCLSSADKLLTLRQEWAIVEGGEGSSCDGRGFRFSESIDSKKMRGEVMGILRIRRMKSKKGLTLIELLIVIVIVGVLAAVAIPTYSGYMERARRADAKTALEQLRAAQEMCRAEVGRYARDGDARFGANALAALRTTFGGPGATSGDYAITMVATTATFTGTATPNTSRQTPDGALTIDQNGTKLPAAKWAK